VRLLLDIAIGNALMAGILALVAAAVSHLCRRPAVTHAVWLLVLLKLVTPPLWKLPVQSVVARFTATPAVAVAPRADSKVLTVSTKATNQHLHLSSPLALPPEEVTPAVVPSAPNMFPSIPRETAVRPAPQFGKIQSSHIEKTSPAPIPWQSLLWLAFIGTWLIGTIACAAVIGIRLLCFLRILRFATVAPPNICRQTAQLAGQLKISCPEVWLVAGAVCPMLFALGIRARILLPTALWERLNDAQRSSLLVHELAHFRRGDHWVRLLELLVTILYWWHPAAWWARHELREAEEQCCDAWVLWLWPRDSRHYATALLDTVDFVSERRACIAQSSLHRNRLFPAVPVLASGMGEFHRLKRRLIMIKSNQVTRKLSGAGFASVCGLAAVLLPVNPGFSQSAPAAPAPREAAPTDQRTVQEQPSPEQSRVDRAVEEQLRVDRAVEKQLSEDQLRADPTRPGHPPFVSDTPPSATEPPKPASPGDRPASPEARTRSRRSPTLSSPNELRAAREEIQALKAALEQSNKRLEELSAAKPNGGPQLSSDGDISFKQIDADGNAVASFKEIDADGNVVITTMRDTKRDGKTVTKTIVGKTPSGADNRVPMMEKPASVPGASQFKGMPGGGGMRGQLMPPASAYPSAADPKLVTPLVLPQPRNLPLKSPSDNLQGRLTALEDQLAVIHRQLEDLRQESQTVK
jgi:bla regulator protein BlaR1